MHVYIYNVRTLIILYTRAPLQPLQRLLANCICIVPRPPPVVQFLFTCQLISIFKCFVRFAHSVHDSMQVTCEHNYICRRFSRRNCISVKLPNRWFFLTLGAVCVCVGGGGGGGGGANLINSSFPIDLSLTFRY